MALGKARELIGNSFEPVYTLGDADLFRKRKYATIDIIATKLGFG